jgi:glycine hydroxymethyltransferase
MSDEQSPPNSALNRADRDVFDLIEQEKDRQRSSIRLIPSENYSSRAVMEATGSVLTNKYSEGYPGKRYYQGQAVIDRIESLAMDRAKELFGAEHANVQPYSGSPANQAVYMALLEPGGLVMGLSLPQGGHLTHGWEVNFSARYYRSVQYGLDPDSGRLDFDAIRRLAQEHRPRLIFAGATAYPRTIDFAAFGEIAREVGAYFAADISHISGLVATGLHPHPFPHADVIMTTTHKLLRGPRGGIILCKKELASKIDRAVFPGLQGGPHNNITAAIAVALAEAARPEYKDYCARVIANAVDLAQALQERGFDLVSGGTDNHLLLIDLRNKGLEGRPLAFALERAGIVCNYNMVPTDDGSPQNPKGIRMGTPAVTTRGMGRVEMVMIADWIDRVAQAPADEAVLAAVEGEVAELCRRFPCPGLDD